MMRMLPLLLATFIAACLAPSTSALAKPPEGVEIKWEIGYNGIVHPSRVNPVIVDMDNQSADRNISGELILEYGGYEYATPLELPTPSKKRFFLYFPCDNYPPGLTLRIRSKGYNDEFELSRDYKPMKPEDVSVVVLSRTPGSLGMLNQQPVVHLNRNLYINEFSELSGGKVFVSYFNIDEVDYNPKFFSRADAIIIGDIDYQQVTPEFAETIKACASGGTSVVLSTGRNGPGLAGSPLAAISPLMPAATVQLDSLGSFGGQYGIAVKDSPATFATGSVASGATVAAWAGELPAVARRTLGSGTVTALAFDFEDVPFKQNAGLARMFMDHALGVGETVSVRNWFMHPQPVSRILKKLGEAKPITPSFVFLFLLAYILLVGPLNFLILGRIKRSTLVWTTIPLLVLSFTWLGIRTGELTRGSDNVTAFFQELHIYPDAAYTPYQTTMLVFTAERSNYELKVPDRSAFFSPKVPELLDPYYANFGGGARGGGIRGFTQGSVDNSAEPVANVSQGKWTSEVYYYQGNLSMQQQVSSNISALRGANMLSEQAGSFTLDLPFDLSNCYLMAPHIGSNNSHHLPIGNLKGKGTYDIASLSGNADATLPSDNYLVENLEEFMNGQRNSAHVGLGYRDEILLVGFTDKVEALAEFSAPHVEHSLNMVVVHLPYSSRVSEDGPAELVRWQLSGGSGFSLQRYGQGVFSSFDSQDYRFAVDGFMEISFEVGGSIKRDTPVYISLSGMDNNGNELMDFGNVELQLWRDGRWVVQNIAPNETTVRVPLEGLLDENRRGRFRMKSLVEQTLRLPGGSIPR